MNPLRRCCQFQRRALCHVAPLIGATVCLVSRPTSGYADTPQPDPASATAASVNASASTVRLAATSLAGGEKKTLLTGEPMGKDIPPRHAPDEINTEKAQDKQAAAPFHPTFSFGGELFMGVTNVLGVRARNNDGVWAANGTALPSNLALSWKESETRSFRLSVGVGDMYTGRDTSFRQPVEMFYQLPGKGGSNFTVGKFYVPFATQEYEYESKWGLMTQGTRGRIGYAASLNYNNQTNNANAYLRLGRQWNTGTTLGFSMGAGRGVFFGTTHDVAVGLDVTQEFKGIRLNSEYNVVNGPQGPFQFAFGKLTLTNLKRFEPYIGAYYEGDHAQQLGNFYSLLGGVNYHMTRTMALESGYARANGRNVFWFQSHVTF